MCRAALVALLGFGWTGSALAETLADAVALAYVNNPGLTRQRYVQKGRDEDYVQARSQYGPTLTASASGGYTSDRTLGQTVNGNGNQASLSFNQPLYTMGRLRGQLAAARAEVSAGQEQVRSAEQTTVRDVIIVYASVLRDQARLEVGRENVAVLRQQLDENQARRRAGDVTLTDVGQADARVAAAEAQLAALEQSLAVSRSQYLQVVGQNPGTLEPLPDLEGIPATLAEALQIADQHNPDLAAARYNEQQSRAHLASIRGEMGPTISATAEATYSNRLLHIDGRNGRRELSAGLTISQPIFTSGLIRSRVRQADADNMADQAGIDDARRTALQAVASAWSELAAMRTSLSVGERQIASAQLAFAGMQREQRFGLRSTIDTLNAEQELASAQLNFLANRFTEYVSRASLLQAMGTLSARTIASDVATYDPNANFKKVRNRGMTPLEPIARTLDKIGSASIHRRPSPALSGELVPRLDSAPPLPPTPSKKVLQDPLVPITQSPLITADSLTDDLTPAARKRARTVPR